MGREDTIWDFETACRILELLESISNHKNDQRRNHYVLKVPDHEKVRDALLDYLNDLNRQEVDCEDIENDDNG